MTSPFQCAAPGPSTVERPAAPSPADGDRYLTERPPPQPEGVVSDPDQYLPELPRRAAALPPGREVPTATNPDF